MSKQTFPRKRPRRLRASPALRALVRENHLDAGHLIQPLFVHEAPTDEPIAAMPGCSRLSPESLLEKCRRLSDLGIGGVALFPVIAANKKEPRAAESINPQGLLQCSLRALKQACPSLLVFSDVAMDPYSSDGHDGLLRNGHIVNDESVEILVAMALSQAQAGTDFVAPSDMMDGRIGKIRDALDREGFQHVGILSYAAKYCSAFYGPFREALDSAPRSGDKRTYQMDPANSREALREIELDIEEGADIVMIKPGLPYLDVLRAARDRFDIPLAVYNVSGEYAMVKAAAAQGWIDERAVVLESLTAFRRAGADIILTYHAESAAKWLKKVTSQ